jgi:UDP-N-acetylmuramoyl-tripeptide--D-alanyl-D-alanine ligase
MINLSTSTLAHILQATLIGPNQDIEEVSTHSNQIKSKTLFVALKGQNFDAHDFVSQAIKNQAQAVLVTKKMAVPSHVTQLIVADTQKALGTLSAYVCEQINPLKLALTGSCGKTTVKEMLTAMMQLQGHVHWTHGNFNNEIGVPLTLLGLKYEHDIGVFELGANHQHEIDYTSSLIKPDIALINNIAPAHLEGFGSIDGVAEAKSEIFNHMSHQGVAIINSDDDYAHFITNKTQHLKQITYSSKKTAQVYATQITADSQGCAHFVLNIESQRCSIMLSMPGRHQVDNALAAAAMAHAANVPLDVIKQGLEQANTAAGRMQLHPLNQLLLVDDTYNANPKSVKAAIDWLHEQDGSSWLILGDMGEMGSDHVSWHQKVGSYAKEQRIEKLFTLGTSSKHTSESYGSGLHFSDFDTLCAALKKHLSITTPKNILVKGSRSANMERVVDALKHHLMTGEPH